MGAIDLVGKKERIKLSGLLSRSVFKSFSLTLTVKRYFTEKERKYRTEVTFFHNKHSS